MGALSGEEGSSGGGVEDVRHCCGGFVAGMEGAGDHADQASPKYETDTYIYPC